MAKPIVTLNDTTWEFTEKANTTGSSFLHTETHAATFKDDNATNVNKYGFVITFAHDPNPSVLPGTVNIAASFSYSPSMFWTGDVDVKFSVKDELLDFLAEGETRTQKIKIRVNDSHDGTFTDKIITVKIHGKNDNPTAKVDNKTIGEDTASHTRKVLSNDKDVDNGDHIKLFSSSVESVTSGEVSFLKTSMVSIQNVMSSGATVKDSLKVMLDKAFQGLATGESAKIVIKYTIVDDLGAKGTTEYRVTVNGQDDDVINGTDGSDKNLWGEKNADKIFGMNGDDIIRPRGGHDEMTGGDGMDKFMFLAKSDSSNTNPDDILDFVHGDDLIDMSKFAGTFEFRGTNAFNGGHDIRYVDMGGFLRVEVDTDGDMDIDMKIDVHGVASLVKEDFVL